MPEIESTSACTAPVTWHTWSPVQHLTTSFTCMEERCHGHDSFSSRISRDERLFTWITMFTVIEEVFFAIDAKFTFANFLLYAWHFHVNVFCYIAENRQSLLLGWVVRCLNMLSLFCQTRWVFLRFLDALRKSRGKHFQVHPFAGLFPFVYLGSTCFWCWTICDFEMVSHLTLLPLLAGFDTFFDFI